MSVSPISGAVPSPPRPLGPEGTRFWQRVWAQPAEWINPVNDLDYVAVLCELMDERQMLRLYVLQNQLDRHHRSQLRAIDEQVTNMLGALGMNPTSRKSIHQPGGGQSDAANRLAQLRQRSKGR